MCSLRELQTTVRRNIEKLRARDEMINSLKKDLTKKVETIRSLRYKLAQYKVVLRAMTSYIDCNCDDDIRSIIPECFSQPIYKHMRNKDKDFGGEINVNFELDSVGGSEDSLSDEAIEESSVNNRVNFSTKKSPKRTQISQNTPRKNLSSPVFLQLPTSPFLTSPSLSAHSENSDLQKQDYKKTRLAKSCFGKRQTFARKSRKSTRDKTSKHLVKNKNYNLLKTESYGNVVSSPSKAMENQNIKNTEEQPPFEKCRDVIKGRNKAKPSVHNWLKKHTKWRRKSNPDDGSGECVTMSNSEYVDVCQNESEKRKRSIWKKGLSYMWPPKSMSPKATANCISVSSANLESPYVNVYNSYDEQPALASVAVQTSPLFMDYSFQHDPQNCIYATHVEQAYLQRCRERMAYLERFGAEHFVLANLQQAAVLEEQTRVARLNQCFFLKRIAESLEIRNAVESMECETDKAFNDLMDIDPPSPNPPFAKVGAGGLHAQASLHNLNQADIHSTMDGIGYPFTPSNCGEIRNPTHKGSKNPSHHFASHPATFSSKFHDRESVSMGAESRNVPPTAYNLLSEPFEIKKFGAPRRKTSRKFFSSKSSPNGEESAFGIFHKRFKRNAISAEPPCSYNTTAGAGCSALNKKSPAKTQK